MIVLPLCDGSHFNGYIVDLNKRNIVCIDLMYAPKSGKRSISAKLKEAYFDSHIDVTFSLFFEQRVQFDGNSCGAWLVVAYILQFEQHGNILTRAKVIPR